jgi:hypothetical protein
MSCATEYFGPLFVVNITTRQPIQRYKWDPPNMLRHNKNIEPESDTSAT